MVHDVQRPPKLFLRSDIAHDIHPLSVYRDLIVSYIRRYLCINIFGWLRFSA